MAFAKKQIGKPYVFGATGPGKFDCSGLTQAAYKSAGVHISRLAHTQLHDGKSVSKSDLKPGDLEFFSGPSPTHVGIYAGHGTVVHAPKPGKSVQYLKMKYMPFAGASRPG